MNSKQSYYVSYMLADGKCIENIFTKKTGGSITRPLPLMLQECGCTRTAGTAGAAVLSLDGGAGYASVKVET